MDRGLLQKVRETMRADERLAGEAIRVSITGGFVFLRGAVTTYSKKLAAEETAGNVSGVEGVVNALVVEPEQAVSDSSVADYVRAALDAHADLPRETITVSVVNGAVTLSGNVLTDAERETAERVALRVRGVRSVRNLILIDRAAESTDLAIAKSIKQKLRKRRDLAKLPIQVSVNNDTVVLSGRVPHRAHRMLAEEVARRSQVLHVRNEIEILED